MADKFWASAEEEGPFTVGPYLTRKDAIGDAPYALDLKDGDYFYVGEEFSIIDRVGVNVDSILDHVGYQAYELAGDSAQEWPPFNESYEHGTAERQLEAELDAVLHRWLNENCPPTFFGIEAITEHRFGKGD